MRRLLGALAAVLSVAAVSFGFDDQPSPVSLFDGKSLEGWVLEHTEGFTVHESVIAVKGSNGWLRSAKAYKNFELDLEFRVAVEASEGGLLFRTSLESAATEPYWPVKGYQLQIADGEGNFMLFGHGTNPPRFERKTDALKMAAKELGAWQKLNLKVVGPRMEAKLNDALVTVSDAIDPTAGHLGLLGKTGQFEWKNISIRVHPD